MESMAFKTKLKSKKGQSTVEFALVAAAFISLVIALGVIWRTFDEGTFVDHAAKSASHHVEQVYPGGGLSDIVVY